MFNRNTPQPGPPQTQAPTSSQARKGRISTKVSPAPQVAHVKELAEEPAIPGSPTSSTVDIKIIERIQKCLDRANHSNTSEVEAQTALRLSSRLMSEYNVTRAHILAQTTTSDDRARLGGQSVVSIRSTKSEYTRVNSSSWVDSVSIAVQDFFDCKAYSTAMLYTIEWTFYGIAQNTVAAAIAFEMAHNLILEWSGAKKSGKADYRMGADSGLEEIAREERNEEEKQAKLREKHDLQTRVNEEEKRRQAELSRLQTSHEHMDISTTSDEIENNGDEQRRSDCVFPSDNVSSSSDKDDDNSDDDNDDNNGNQNYNDNENENDSENEFIKSEPTFKIEDEAPIDLSADFEQQMTQQATKFSILHNNWSNDPKSSPTSQSRDNAHIGDLPVPSASQQETSSWKTSTALIQFRNSAAQIAEDYLESKNTRLRKGRMKTASVRDYDAYRQGKRDSRKIDVKRRRIEGAKS